MEQRLNFFAKGMDAVKPLFGVAGYIKKSTLEPSLIELIDFRVSQINKCAYCLDMHSKDAFAKGENPQRLYCLTAWRETPFYTERERAALAWAEAVTACHVTDDVYAEAAGQFTEDELIALTMAVANINTWNRINISFPNKVGSYQVGMFG